MIKIRETVRNDGLRVISCFLPHTQRVHLELVSLTGAASDPPEKQGISHLLEHMVFKGTKTRPVRHFRIHGYRHLVDENAITEHTTIRYFCVTIEKNLEAACEFLCDEYCNAMFPEEELKREKQVVLGELRAMSDDPVFLAHKKLWSLLWSESPYRRDVLGTISGIRNITRQDLLQARERWHTPGNTVALAVGNINHAAFFDQVSRRIPVKMQKSIARTWADEYALPPKSKRRSIFLDRGGAIVLLGFKFPLLMASDRENITRKFFERIIGSSVVSRLWEEVREKTGLSYEFGGRVEQEYPLGAYFALQAEIDPRNIKLVEEIFRRILTEPITEAEAIEATRESFENLFTTRAENPEDWANIILNKLKVGVQPETLENYFADQFRLICDISLEEIEKLRSAVVLPEKFATIIVRPKK